MEKVFEVMIETGAKYEARGAESLNIKPEDWCVIRKDKCQDYGQVVCEIGEFNEAKDDKNNPMPIIDRKATVVDKGKANENIMRSKSAYKTAEKLIEELGLQMKLLNCHYSYDRKLVNFQFTADGRVDFRELVKRLSQALGTRIELRQIGVRDETSILGGIGPCGQVVCCNRFIKEFQSINVRMAKEQVLSLNPNNISGLCCRLKCCLKYEHEGYLEMDKAVPRKGCVCECAAGKGRVIDRNLLTRKVTLYIEGADAPQVCNADEVKVVAQEDRSRSPSDTQNIDEEALKKLEG